MNPAVTALLQTLGDRGAAGEAAIKAIAGAPNPLGDVGRSAAPMLAQANTGGGYGGGGGTVSMAGLSPAEAWIIQRESGGRTTAQNPHSTAFGIWQGLQSTRNTYGRQLGINPNTTDYGQQLAMFRAYVRARYGTAENAQRFWQRNGWY